MASKKKRDLLNKKMKPDSPASLEGFLDKLETSGDLPAKARSVSKKSSIALLLAKILVLTTVVISSLMWFIWPEMKHSPLLIQNYQEDKKMEQVVGRLEAIEQTLKLQKSDRQADLSVIDLHNTKEAAKLAKQKAEAKQLIYKRAKEDAAQLAKQKTTEVAQKKSEAIILTPDKAEATEAPVVVKPLQKRTEPLNIVKNKTVPPQAVAVTKVSRPFVPFAGKKFYIYKVSANIANVRSSPNSKATVVAKLLRDTKVIVLKQVGDWYQIRLHKSKRGWIYHTLLK